MRHPNHLGSLRKQWKLSEDELARLLGYRFRSAVHRIATNERTPSLWFVLACEVVFGESPRQLFPALYETVEDQVMRRAKKLDDALRHDYSAEAVVKRRLLSAMAKRAAKRGRP